MRTIAGPIVRSDTILEYSALQKSCHWTIALLCVVEFTTAVGIQRSHLGHVFGIKPSSLDVFRAFAHQWSGGLILAITVVLIGSRLVQGAPSLPAGMSLWQRWSAHLVHGAIYVGLVVLVLTRVGAMYLDGRLTFVHIVLAKVGVDLIAIHVAAALWHQLVRRDRLLERMSPLCSHRGL